MKNLTADQIKDQYQKLIYYIETYISQPRKSQLLKLYQDHAMRIATMPASGVEHYHNCFPGGYVDHVLRVVQCGLQVMELWKSMGATINYTEEELVFSALNHDLGKIGTEEFPQYIENKSEWHRKNLGKLYTNNPANSFMTVPDRSLKLLADRGIAVSENEWLAIRLHDGLFDEANKAYFFSREPDSKLRTNLPYVLHQADMMAARIEYEMWLEAKNQAQSKLLNSLVG